MSEVPATYNAKPQGLALNTIDEMSNFGSIMVASGMFPDLKSQAQAIVKMVAGRELGFPPLYSLQHINVIQGKTGIDAGAMASLIKRDGSHHEYQLLAIDDTKCTVRILKDGKALGDSTFTIDDARKAGLAERDMWKKYPRNMLFSRAISNAARWYCPHLIGGAYTQEELSGPSFNGTVEMVPEAPVVEAEVREVDPTSPAALRAAMDATRPLPHEQQKQQVIDAIRDRVAKLKDAALTYPPIPGGKMPSAYSASELADYLAVLEGIWEEAQEAVA